MSRMFVRNNFHSCVRVYEYLARHTSHVLARVGLHVKCPL